MKHLILSCILIVSPVMAAEDVLLNLNAEQREKCEAEGGCLVVTVKAARTLYEMGLAQGYASCKGTI